ncbi:MAG: GNAT family N-acetyltransferase [Lapillicoccus sp.]
MRAQPNPHPVDGAITFRALTAAEFPLLAGWLAQPHVHRWWQHETTTDAVERDFGPGTRGEEPGEDHLVLLDGVPVGLLQRCFFRDYPDMLAELAAVVEVPDGAVTLDYLIGNPELVGRGLGTRIIGEASAAVWRDLPDATCLVVPVSAANVASWTALARAGFRRVAEGDLEPEHPDDPWWHVISRLDRP